MTVVTKATAALSLVLALAACTSPAPEKLADQPDTPPTSTPATGASGAGTPAAGAPATSVPAAPSGKYSVAQLKSALMTTADMPKGWSAGTAGKVGPETYQSGCAALDAINHRKRTKAEATFVGGEQGPVIAQGLISTTPAEAKAMIAGVDKVVRECPVIDMQSTGAPLRLTVTRTSLTPLGDDSSSLRLSGPGVTFDDIFVRQDGVVLVIAIVTSGDGPDQATITAITRTALTKADQRLKLTA